MTKHEQWPLGPGSVDLLVGGTPCPSFSVAGLRRGLSDPRGGLMLTYLEIAQRLRPRWVVWENVPGVLSSGRGRDFGSFVGALGELGYGWAYRVLDAQWVRTQRHPRAVPQRRRRVFVVGCLGDGAAAAAVLFERESVQRDSAPRRAPGQGAAADAEGCAGTVSSKWANGTGGPARDECYNLTTQPVASTLGNRGLRSHTELDGHGAYIPQVVPYDLFQITAPVNRQNRQPGDPCHTLARDNAAHAAIAVSVDLQNVVLGGSVAGTLDTTRPSRGGGQAVAHAFYSTGGTHGVNQQTEVSPAVKVGSGLGIPSPPAVAHCVAPTITSGNDPSRSPQSAEVTQQVAAVHAASMTVRRLTPRECERLQGFPDDWTMIPWRKKPAEDCPDGPRYRALGNSMAVNVMALIGERIDNYERTRNAVRTEG